MKKSEFLLVPLGADVANCVSQLGADCCDLLDLSKELVGNRNIVVIGLNETVAEQEMSALIARGISSARIEFAVIRELTWDGFQAAFAARRHKFWRDVKLLKDAPEPEPEENLPLSGIGFLDRNFGWRWRMRELGIVAGPYGSGKSTLMQQLAFNFVAVNGRRLGTGALLCAWEDEPSEMRRNLHAFAENYDDFQDRRDDRWRYDGDPRFVVDNIHYVCRPPEDDRLVSWFMDLIQYHHSKYGTKFFTLDPWNELDHKRDVRQMETEYTRDMMKEFRRIVDRLGIILLIATHVPAKMIRGDGTIEPFRIAHSFGSSQFGNKADRGLCVARSKALDCMVLHLDKVKVERSMGKKGTVAARWDVRLAQYVYDSSATAQVQDIWKD